VDASLYQGIEGIRGGGAAPTGTGGIKVDASLLFQRGVDKVGDIDPRVFAPIEY
jgi:hypothetical protein